MDQSVVFTLLPQDTAPDGRLRASLFVSPRLTPDGPGTPASAFPAFADWPAIVARGRVLVEKSGVGTVDAEVDTTQLRSNLWAAYLAPLTVEGWTFRDLSDTEIRSYPAQEIVALARGLYRAVAAESQGDHPHPFAGGLRTLGAAYLEVTGDRPLREDGGRITWDAGRRAAAAAELRKEIDERVDRALDARRDRRGQARGHLPHGGPSPATSALDPDAALADPLEAALNLAEARRFYDRPEARDPRAAEFPEPSDDYKPDKVENDDPDFHAVLGALADHPALLRALGVIIPITLDPAFVGAGGDLRAWLEHDALQPNGITVQPWTRTVVDGAFFQPVSDTGDLAGGTLLLDDPNRFDVAQVDIDSTALLVEQRVANVHPIADATADGVKGDLPALRSSGFTVTRLSRAIGLEQRIGRAADNAKDLANGKEIVLYAEDLVRGYRADVHDGHAWRSLMHRTVRYLDATTKAELLATVDEAYLKASAMTQTPKAAKPPAYLHEALFGWDGWSLAVPRPGSHIPVDTPPTGQPPVVNAGGEFSGQLDVHVETGLVEGTLPRLRYGGDYRMRLRTVDLSGVSTEQADDSHASAAHTFRRFQPVAHPVVVQRHPVTEGESTLRLVIRSGVEAEPLTPVDPATYAATLNSLAPRQFATYRASAQRHLVPPKVGQSDAELLGAFDLDAIGVSPAAADYRRAYARAQREQGTLLDTVIRSADDPAVTTPAVNVHLMPPLARDGDFTRAQLDAKLAKLARGDAPEAGFTVVHDTDTLLVPYLPDPLATGVALRFTGHGTARGWTHTEIVPLSGPWPDVETCRLVLESGPTPQVTASGVVVTVTLPPGATATVRSSSTVAQWGLDLLGMWDWIADTVAPADLPDVLAGGHQMLTPRETLVLVHATQRPLERPRVAFRAHRAYGETHTRFRGSLAAQAATTSRLDVEAHWSEWFDDPASGEPPRLVDGYTGHAFDLPVAEDADTIDLTDAPTGPASADPRHELHDTLHRFITYVPAATTRFREYLPAAVTELSVTGPGTAVHVPCSARSAAPAVHSVMPTFRWSDLPDDPFDPGIRARRRHGGLRVWLRRPWYASGDGELLGVVLTGADGIMGDKDLRRQYTSLWGKDPIRRTGELPAPVPRPRDFRGDGLVVRDRLTLAEFGRGPGVTVVGHPVAYSAERDLWYADLDIDPGEASWPFLRLALVRFQPWSVPGAELSPVTVVDFVQLTNDRTASVVRPDADTVSVTVSGIADRTRAAAMPPGLPLPSPIDDLERGTRAWIERRGPLATDLDWSPAGQPVELARIDEDQVARVWSATVPLPERLDPRRPGTDPDGGESAYRLVVAEWESLPFDEPFADGRPIERYVYLDRFPL